MPNAYIEKIHKKNGIPIKKLEGIWAKAEKAAKKAGMEGNYAYTMKIFKTMIKEKPSVEQLSLIPLFTKW